MVLYRSILKWKDNITMDRKEQRYNHVVWICLEHDRPIDRFI